MQQSLEREMQQTLGDENVSTLPRINIWTVLTPPTQKESFSWGRLTEKTYS